MRDAGWDEMAHRQQMLMHARAMGATHIAIVDADEILTGDLVQKYGYAEESIIRHAVASVPQNLILRVPLYNLRGSIDRYHANGIWGDRWLGFAFKDAPNLSWAGDKIPQP